MSDEARTVTIRSFRNCFKLERRIHKIDRWQIPLPFGIPVRSIGYALGALLALLVLAALPGIGVAVRAMGIEVRVVVLPLAIAWLMTNWQIDGRPAHATLRSLVKMRARPARIAAWRPAPAPGVVTLGDITAASDERRAQWRPAVIEGPALVLVRYPFTARRRRSALELTAQPGPPQWRGKEIRIAAGRKVVIR